MRNASGVAIIHEKGEGHARYGFVLIIQPVRTATKKSLPWYATPISLSSNDGHSQAKD